MRHRRWNDVGIEFATAGWGRTDERDDMTAFIKSLTEPEKQTALLVAIVNLLNQKEFSDAERLDRHRLYLTNGSLDRDKKLLVSFTNEVNRIIRMCHGVDAILYLWPVERIFLHCDIHALSREYAYENINYYHNSIAKVKTSLALLKKVRSVNDFLLFDGFGKRKLQHLKDRIAEAKRKQKSK